MLSRTSTLCVFGNPGNEAYTPTTAFCSS